MGPAVNVRKENFQVDNVWLRKDLKEDIAAFNMKILQKNVKVDAKLQGRNTLSKGMYMCFLLKLQKYNCDFTYERNT